MDGVSVNLFADDTLVSTSDDSFEEAYEKMNSELEKLSDWLKFNKVALNVKKSKCIYIKKSFDDTTPRVSIDGNEIELVDHVKYLGVMIDSNLNFKIYFEYIKKKLNKKLGFLRRIQNKLTAESKITYYKSIVAPHIDYCSSILFTADETSLDEMQRIQNKFLRNILMVKRDTSVNLMLDALQFLSVRQKIN
jgi:hypothetical protein